MPHCGWTSIWSGRTTRLISPLRDINVAESMFWMNEWISEWKALSMFQLQWKYIIIYARCACLSAGAGNISQQYQLDRQLRLTGGHQGLVLSCSIIIRRSIFWLKSHLPVCVAESCLIYTCACSFDYHNNLQPCNVLLCIQFIREHIWN